LAAKRTEWYNGGMREKTSVTLTKELLVEIRRIGGRKVNRSEFLEKAAWDRIAALKRKQREARDREILDREARKLNAEALEVLEYQADW
jgi:metal-responsive CopG/Arc/MetJ family transcriptional regulator